ncbi:TetR/AcrR family transcriptional regulator [Bradyrhizobium pachyrhizi]|uniref:TetR/AcrR family transcriptional regulator n=1 Tax=Bradyrhizobium pachyrhizi TaxID=280333 RepID=UPI0024B05F06|nr:TetR/AcrR family transcriptional regulator [Bradyrhizobium pachyrhizi]WFU58321.1 TetR/AcrR family transcriptional regulator [Bradyrhizobium pachyrhizi]
MTRKIDILLKKRAKQQRSIATVGAIVEAATYILTHHGRAGFTANKVVEKAGVNIASFYQYFPNKEALLFHIIKLNWEKQLAKLLPILRQRGRDHARRLRDFIREFFIVEAAEADLRRALRAASIDLKDTEEFQALISKGVELIGGFIKEAVKDQTPDELDFNVNFVVLLITSFAERTTDEQTSGAYLIRQADLLSDMLIGQFKLS